MAPTGKAPDLIPEKPTLPRLREAANDPTLVEEVKKFDLKKALEYAAKED